MIYVIIADDTIDQICETKQIANKEKRDLQDMGCVVKIKPFNTWAEAEAFEDNFNKGKN